MSNTVADNLNQHGTDKRHVMHWHNAEKDRHEHVNQYGFGWREGIGCKRRRVVRFMVCHMEKFIELRMMHETMSPIKICV